MQIYKKYYFSTLSTSSNQFNESRNLKHWENIHMRFPMYKNTGTWERRLEDTEERHI